MGVGMLWAVEHSPCWEPVTGCSELPQAQDIPVRHLQGAVWAVTAQSRALGSPGHHPRVPWVKALPDTLGWPRAPSSSFPLPVTEKCPESPAGPLSSTWQPPERLYIHNQPWRTFPVLPSQPHAAGDSSSWN